MIKKITREISSKARLVHTKSFTIIELLVVIAIIGILLSIMLPSIQKARDKVKASVCISNQKQLGVGLIVFSMDKDSFLPTNAAWNDNWQRSFTHHLLTVSHFPVRLTS